MDYDCYFFYGGGGQTRWRVVKPQAFNTGPLAAVLVLGVPDDPNTLHSSLALVATSPDTLWVLRSPLHETIQQRTMATWVTPSWKDVGDDSAVNTIVELPRAH